MTGRVFVRSATPFGDQVLETAYNSVAAELQALAPEVLVRVNLDIMAAVNTAAGVIPQLKALRSRIVLELPRFDVAAFDKLHLYALAAAYAHTLHLVAAGPRNDLRPMFEEAAKLRALLLSDATALVARGLLHGDVLKRLKGATGYKNVQTDLQMLVNVFRANWANVQGKCAVAEAELARGGQLVAWLMEVVGLRQQGPADRAKSAEARVRAFTLFTRAYDDARRAVGFLRWKEGDVDDIIPSLYAGRSNGRAGTGKKAAKSPASRAIPTVEARAAAPAPAAARPGGPFAALDAPENSPEHLSGRARSHEALAPAGPSPRPEFGTSPLVRLCAVRMKSSRDAAEGAFSLVRHRQGRLRSGQRALHASRTTGELACSPSFRLRVPEHSLDHRERHPDHDQKAGSSIAGRDIEAYEQGP